MRKLGCAAIGLAIGAACLLIVKSSVGAGATPPKDAATKVILGLDVAAVLIIVVGFAMREVIELQRALMSDGQGGDIGITLGFRDVAVILLVLGGSVLIYIGATWALATLSSP